MEILIVILVIIIIALVALCLKLSKERKPAPKEQIVIEVCKSVHSRPADDPRYHAQIKDNSEICANGSTFYAAIGALVNHYYEETGIDIKYLDDISR